MALEVYSRSVSYLSCAIESVLLSTDVNGPHGGNKGERKVVEVISNGESFRDWCCVVSLDINTRCCRSKGDQASNAENHGSDLHDCCFEDEEVLMVYVLLLRKV